jgi:hypothetical protein
VKRAALAAIVVACALAGAFATRAPDPTPVAAPRPAPVLVRAAEPVATEVRALPRVLQPDAERAGQVAGQLAEARYRLARAGGSCDDAVLDDAAARFADARVHADDADWAALAAVLDDALAALEPCPEAAGVRDRLRVWRRLPPFPPQ